MKKLIYILFFILVFTPFVYAGLFKKETKPELYLTSYDPRIASDYSKNKPINVFKKGDRIYFSITVEKGFKSDFIKYQIIKQDDNAHTGGYSRFMNKTVRVSNKNNYVDYFVINTKGKYFLQIFDITNLHQWIAMGAFAVLDE